MQKLFTTQFGSRLYGTQTPTSDMDIKHIVLVPKLQLLMGEPLINVVNHTNTKANTKNTAEDVDEEFIPLQIFAKHFMDGQTYALELAFAVDGRHAGQQHYKLVGPDEPDHPVPFSEARAFVDFVHQLRTNFLTSNIKAMMGYAVNQANIYSLKGERLNVVTEFTAIIDECTDLSMTLAAYAATQPAHDKLTKLAIDHPKYFSLTEYDIGGGRMRPAAKVLEKILPFGNAVSEVKVVLAALRKKYGARAEAASANNVDWKALMHAVRIVDEGIELLRYKRLTLPLPPEQVEFLLEIKRGEIPIDEVKAVLDSKLEFLKQLEAESTLPTKAELEATFKAFMGKWISFFYNTVDMLDGLHKR